MPSIEKKLAELTTLAFPENQSATRVLSLQISVGGMITKRHQREGIRVVNEAMAAIRGLNRFIDSGGVIEAKEAHWRMALPSNDSNDCVEFTVILR